MREGDWKPLNPGYDFLRMMEKDEERAQRKHDDAASGADGTGTPVPQSFTKGESAAGKRKETTGVVIHSESQTFMVVLELRR